MNFPANCFQSLPDLPLQQECPFSPKSSVSDDESSGYSSSPTTPSFDTLFDLETILSADEKELDEKDIDNLVTEILRENPCQQGKERQILHCAAENQIGLAGSSFPQTVQLRHSLQQDNFALRPVTQTRPILTVPNIHQNLPKVPAPAPNHQLGFPIPFVQTGNAAPIVSPLYHPGPLPVWNLDPSVSPPAPSPSGGERESKGKADKLKRVVPQEMKDQKYWKRRIRNNLSARRSREAKRAKEQITLERAERLEEENLQLKKMVAILMDKLNELPTCQLLNADWPVEPTELHLVSNRCILL